MERSRVRRSFEERKGDAAGGEEETACDSHDIVTRSITISGSY